MSTLAAGGLLFVLVFFGYIFFFIYRQFISLPGPASDILSDVGATGDGGRIPPLILISILFALGAIFVAYAAAVADGLRNTSVARSLFAFVALTAASAVIFSVITVFLFEQDKLTIAGKTVNQWELAALDLRITVDRHLNEREDFETYWAPYRQFVITNVTNAFTQPEPFVNTPETTRFTDIVVFFFQDAFQLLVFFGDLPYFEFSELEPNGLAPTLLVITFRVATLALVLPVLIDGWRVLQKRVKTRQNKVRKRREARAQAREFAMEQARLEKEAIEKAKQARKERARAAREARKARA